MQLAKIMAVFRNEWKQTFSVGRLIGWLLVSGFPILLVLLVLQFGQLGQSDTEFWSWLLFASCEVTCLLQLLIWATPWLHSELEGLSWVYLSVRPGGKTAVLMGKYLAAATRTMVGAEFALLLSALLIWSLADKSEFVQVVGSQTSSDLSPVRATLGDDPDSTGTQYTYLEIVSSNTNFKSQGVQSSDRVRFFSGPVSPGYTGYEDFTVDRVVSETSLLLNSEGSKVDVPTRVEIHHSSKWGFMAFSVLAMVIAISCFSYAAIFIFLGALFPKRAMVMAVGYSLLVEIGISLVPAMINQISVQFRLRSLLLTWMSMFGVDGSWKPPQGLENLLGDSHTWLHLVILLGLNIGLLFVANLVVSRRQHVANLGG